MQIVDGEHTVKEFLKTHGPGIVFPFIDNRCFGGEKKIILCFPE